MTNNLCPPPLDCCYRVKVAFTRGRSNGAYQLHPYAFGHYVLEPGTVRGRPHYTSEDGRFAIAFCGDSWWVQLASNRGECRGWFTPDGRQTGESKKWSCTVWYH